MNASVFAQLKITKLAYRQYAETQSSFSKFIMKMIFSQMHNLVYSLLCPPNGGFLSPSLTLVLSSGDVTLLSERGRGRGREREREREGGRTSERERGGEGERGRGREGERESEGGRQGDGGRGDATESDG